MASDDARVEESTRVIPLGEIDPGNEEFRVTTRRAGDDFDSSLQRLGLLAAPLVLGGERAVTLLSGFRRVEACRRLGWEAIAARVLPARTPLYACALKAVAENSLQRPLNLIETSRSLSLLERHAPGGKIPPEDAAALGLPGHTGLTARLKTLCRMPAEVQEAVLEDAVSFAMACELGRMDEEAAVALARLFRELKTGLNKQREIVTLIAEIALREGMHPPAAAATPLSGAARCREQLPGAATTAQARREPPADAAQGL